MFVYKASPFFTLPSYAPYETFGNLRNTINLILETIHFMKINNLISICLIDKYIIKYK